MKIALPLLVAVTVVAGAACASKPKPQPEPQVETATVDVTMPSGETRTVPVKLVFVPVPDDVFVAVTVAAAGWAKGTIGGKQIGMYQPDGAAPLVRTAIEAVTARYAFRPITPADFGVVCRNSARTTTSITQQSATCSMKYVEAVLAINSLRMTRDSAYVGASIIRVPSGSNKAETNRFCVTLIRKDQKTWEAKRSEHVVNTGSCPRGWA